MYKILISNVGFGKASPYALELLKNNADIIENKNKIKFSEEDFLKNNINEIDIIIAGTEKISSNIIDKAPNLKLIGRIGAGIDNIDVKYALTRKIKICYTPDAPSLAVPEFTIGLILNLIKGICVSNYKMHNKIWHRPMGRALSECKLGIVGAGKIGAKVIKLIKNLEQEARVYFYDPKVKFIEGAIKIPLDNLFENCDVISIHIPLNNATKNLVNHRLLMKIPKGGYLINTSRGGIIDEVSLYNALKTNLAGAALDVFAEEPYFGNLNELENCILSSHISSMTYKVRSIMENQVAEDVMNFIKNKPIMRLLKKDLWE